MKSASREIAAERREIVILGAGFGGVYTYLNLHHRLHRLPISAGVTIVSPRNYFLFTPLLHEVATGGINRSNVVQPIRQVLRCCVSRFVEAKVDAINLPQQEVQTSAGTIRYDYLVIAMGAVTNFYTATGAPEHSWPLKTISDAIR